VVANLQQDLRQREEQDRQAQFQIELESQRAQDAALQAYLDVMKELLLEEDLRSTEPDSSARAVANVQTLLILERIDGLRMRAVLRLLTDSHLIDADAPLINLDRAELQEVDAEGMDLSDTDLSRTNLEGANLEGANLEGADLSDAFLRGAKGITNEELEQQASSLEGATMPNGQKYEESLKSKSRGEDGQGG
jgi:uncharacterized protein YjbI with pentapeptide repeats